MPFDPAIFGFSLVVIIFSVVLHELAHGYMARALGDDTAERAGRLTLNPIPHLDPVGSVLVPILCSVMGLPGFAWAKPVPFNPANLHKDMRNGPLKVALAGPATNLVLMVVFGMAARFLVGSASTELIAALSFVAVINAFLAVLNLVPIPPFDGFRLIGLVSRSVAERLEGLGPSSLILAFAVIYVGAGVIGYVASFLVTSIASPAAIQAYCAVFGCA